MRVRTDSGFTLLEIMVALFIVSVALLAMQATELQANMVTYGLRERSFAQWVANNRLTELRLAPEWPSTGDETSSTELANIRWRIEVSVSETTDPDLRRIDVAVSLESAPRDVIVRLTGFRGRPQQRPLLPQADSS